MMRSVATELFYTIADAACGQARTAVMERGVREQVKFRNLYYEEVRRDFAARGGREVPALWDGERLHQGLPAVLVALDALRPDAGAP